LALLKLFGGVIGGVGGGSLTSARGREDERFLIRPARKHERDSVLGGGNPLSLDTTLPMTGFLALLKLLVGVIGKGDCASLGDVERSLLPTVPAEGLVSPSDGIETTLLVVVVRAFCSTGARGRDSDR
jgi:hypothetical protein